MNSAICSNNLIFLDYGRIYLLLRRQERRCLFLSKNITYLKFSSSVQRPELLGSEAGCSSTLSSASGFSISLLYTSDILNNYNKYATLLGYNLILLSCRVATVYCSSNSRPSLPYLSITIWIFCLLIQSAPFFGKKLSYFLT